MKLRKILENIKYKNIISKQILDEIEVSDIVYNSKNSKKDTLFVAIKGETVDGHSYVQNAYDLGSRVFIVCQEITLPKDAIIIMVDDCRQALSKASANLFDHPSKKIKVIGVTGTKGKTTITNYIKLVLDKLGINTGVIGTNGIFYNNLSLPINNTTPESYELHSIINQMVNSGVECVAMEVSSSGLMMKRVNDIDFDLGIFTNLSPDHIGPKEHPTFENYRYCKSLLFSLCHQGLVNLDDLEAKFMIDNAKCPIKTFSIHQKSDIQAQNIKLTRTRTQMGSTFEYLINGKLTSAFVSSPGDFSVYNALAVIGVGECFKLDKKKLLEVLGHVQVEGRVELVSGLDDVSIVVDFAHEPLSLENLLTTLKKYDHNRLITVFGSVGERTFARRKGLGKIANLYSDIVVLTSDNPDHEDPNKIIDEIAEVIDQTKVEVFKEADRTKAIQLAISLAKPGDILIVTGKGHEKYQLINGVKEPYNDVEVIKNSILLVK